MKPILLLPLAVLLSVAASFGVARLVLACPATAVTSGASADDLARLAQAIAEIQDRETRLARSIDELRAELAARPSEEARIPVGEIRAEVARALEREGASAPAAAADTTPPAVFDAKAAFEALLGPDVDWDASQEKWKAIDAAGGLDLVVAMFEQYAKDHPESADAQVQLGEAYLQKVFRAGNGPESGTWAIKADQSFDKALAIDDHSWDARFTKAVSLSFWPPVFGKSSEAIKHFEVLVEQQAGQPSQPQFAQTWLLLGNMYQQGGNPAQALATWQGGLALFPGDAGLQQQIQNAQGH